MTKLVTGLRQMKPSAWCGLSALRISGWPMMWWMPSAAMLMNQTSVTGPKKRPMPPVPLFCTANRQNSTSSVSGIT